MWWALMVGIELDAGYHNSMAVPLIPKLDETLLLAVISKLENSDTESWHLYVQHDLVPSHSRIQRLFRKAECMYFAVLLRKNHGAKRNPRQTDRPRIVKTFIELSRHFNHVYPNDRTPKSQISDLFVVWCCRSKTAKYMHSAFRNNHWNRLCEWTKSCWIYRCQL